MKINFNNLGISPPILKAVEEMGFKAPTEIQEKAIPHILNKKDLIAISKTGSGKTAVFGVSLLQQIDPGSRTPQGLILTPTRELAVQVDNDLMKLSKYLKHKTAAVFGKHSMNAEFQALRRGVSIVTGTPGRVYDHIEHGTLQTANIHFLVLDEADRMLDMGFIIQVVRIIKTLPKDRVTMLFSATIPPEIRNICREYMNNPVTVEIASPTKTVDTVDQCYYRVDEKEKRTQLYRLLLAEQPESCMIFCNTRIAADRVQSFLSRKGLMCEVLHGDIPQGKRLKTMQSFKQGSFHLLTATDVAARGIHIENLSLVINYDVPVEKDSYVHRIGRTGRAGKGGRAISLVTGNDIMGLYEIEEHIGALIEEAELPSDALLNERSTHARKWLKENSVGSDGSLNTSSRRNGESGNKTFRSGASPKHYNNTDRRNKPVVSTAGNPKPGNPGWDRYPKAGQGRQIQADSGNRINTNTNGSNRPADAHIPPTATDSGNIRPSESVRREQKPDEGLLKRILRRMLRRLRGR